jgi:hypothetical protein
MNTTPTTIDQAETAPQCSCDFTAIRRRVLSHGVATYVVQCLGCGRQIRSVKKDGPEVRQLAEVQSFDDTLQQTWRDQQRRFYEARHEARAYEQATKQSEWWQRYDAYMRTTAWRLKRQAVLTRANNWCEGCAARPATDIHHTTYAHFENELLFELVAVCRPCHRILHPEMDER